MLIVPHFVFFQDLKIELHRHLNYREFQWTIENNPQAHQNYVVTKDFILQQNRIWLP